MFFTRLVCALVTAAAVPIQVVRIELSHGRPRWTPAPVSIYTATIHDKLAWQGFTQLTILIEFVGIDTLVLLMNSTTPGQEIGICPAKRRKVCNIRWTARLVTRPALLPSLLEVGSKGKMLYADGMMQYRHFLPYPESPQERQRGMMSESQFYLTNTANASFSTPNPGWTPYLCLHVHREQDNILQHQDKLVELTDAAPDTRESFMYMDEVLQTPYKRANFKHIVLSATHKPQ
ncbi:uncharacterized protein BDZ83DRAFT_656666 [Colletotrichum acutatum]|uniref:Uncharacterized protein n=1 Tax=Glomerella acutata TaxID=27357 RepID=A0AAD8UEK3_GLOAC|nr:uncharacterized protein BDZ83DRAFT_656666 [Colletotrichum acutatum]KAK1711976.1 hypothetical protein BDZ83DRAFT_656666 [Colletotrichum acutatum]